jgi:hypothetical protein
LFHLFRLVCGGWSAASAGKLWAALISPKKSSDIKSLFWHSWQYHGLSAVAITLVQAEAAQVAGC